MSCTVHQFFKVGQVDTFSTCFRWLPKMSDGFAVGRRFRLDGAVSFCDTDILPSPSTYFTVVLLSLLRLNELTSLKSDEILWSRIKLSKGLIVQNVSYHFPFSDTKGKPI